MKRILVVGLGAAILAGAAAGAVLATGQSGDHRPEFANKPSSTGAGRAAEVTAANEHAERGLQHASVVSVSSEQPSFAHQPAETGLARAEEVLTILQAEHPDADGLSTALGSVQENAEAHATGQGH